MLNSQSSLYPIDPYKCCCWVWWCSPLSWWSFTRPLSSPSLKSFLFVWIAHTKIHSLILIHNLLLPAWICTSSLINYCYAVCIQRLPFWMGGKILYRHIQLQSPPYPWWKWPVDNVEGNNVIIHFFAIENGPCSGLGCAFCLPFQQRKQEQIQQGTKVDQMELFRMQSSIRAGKSLLPL